MHNRIDSFEGTLQTIEEICYVYRFYFYASLPSQVNKVIYLLNVVLQIPPINKLFVLKAVFKTVWHQIEES